MSQVYHGLIVAKATGTASDYIVISRTKPLSPYSHHFMIISLLKVKADKWSQDHGFGGPPPPVLPLDEPLEWIRTGVLKWRVILPHNASIADNAREIRSYIDFIRQSIAEESGLNFQLIFT